MRLRIIPIVVFLFFGVVMYVLDRFLPVGKFDFFGRKELMLFLLALGGAVAVLALVQFAKYRTTAHPQHLEKVSYLVTKGIYRYSRNPMYLSLLLFLLAWGLFLGNAFNAITAAAFVSYMNAFQIKPEEEALHKKFGEPYARYCTAVRRWF